MHDRSLRTPMAHPAISSTDVNATDRVSSLPEEIRHHILSFLDTETAVRTGILSNKWRNLWSSNPNLNLSFDRDTEADPVAVVNKTISLYNRPTLNSLCIDVTTDDELSTLVKTWIKFATTRNVRELDLRIDSGEDPPVRLPQFLYNHTPLTKLALIYFTVRLPPEFTGFPSLNYLRLCSVDVKEKALATLLSTCPLLEKLDLSSLDLKNLNISAGNLKTLEVHQCAYLKTLVVDASNLVSFTFQFQESFGGRTTDVCLNNVPALKEAKIELGELKDSKLQEYAPLVASIANVDCLLACNWLCQFIYTEYFVRKSPHIMFPNLKEFRWAGCFDYEHELVAFAAFLGDCPSLQKLCINCYSWVNHSTSCSHWSDRYYTQPLQALVRKGSLDFLLPNLKTIKLIKVSGTIKEMDLLRFLLTKAFALDSVILASMSEGLGDDNTLNLHQKLTSLTKAKIVLSKVSWGDFNEQYELRI